MKAIIFNRFVFSGRVHVFHTTLFNGRESSREGYYRPERLFLGDQLTHPLYLLREGSRVPAVFMPGGSLVVSQAVKRRLEVVPNIAFLEVHFLRVIEVPYLAGDYSYGQRLYEADLLLGSAPHRPDLHARLGRYFEVIVPNLVGLLPHYPQARPRQIPQKEEVRLCPELLRDWPLLWSHLGLVCHPSAFALVDPDMDWDYFEKLEIEF